MEQQGWIKLHRKMLDWEWAQDSHTFHLFTILLLSANHESKKWQGITIERGQLVTGRLKLAAQTGMTERQIRTCLERLFKSNEISVKTTNKYSIITVCNYDNYQASEDKSRQQTTNKRPTNDQQTTTNKNDNNDKNDKNKNPNAMHSVSDQINKTDFVDQVVNQFVEAHGNYEIISPGKERKAAGQLIKLYRKKYPKAKSHETIQGLRAYFNKCFKIDNDYFRNNMSLTLMVSKFNEIQNTLKNGQSKNTPYAISGENHIPPEMKHIKRLD